MYRTLFVARQDMVQPVGIAVEVIVYRNDGTSGVAEERIGAFGQQR
jgi:hypothetical protein